MLVSTFFAACDQRKLPIENGEPEPLNISAYLDFKDCSSTPETKLTKSDQCILEMHKKRCLPVDDCIVQCLSSKESRRFINGCDHICEFEFEQHAPPLEGADVCEKLKGHEQAVEIQSL